MKYMGSKNRHAKELLPIILKDRKPGQCYVEPFVGGANMIDKVDGWRIGIDCNPYLIALLKKMQEIGFKSPDIPECVFNSMKYKPDMYHDWALGYAGFQLSYGALWFGSYRRDSKGLRNYSDEAKRNVDKQSGKLAGIEFICDSFENVNLPDCSVVYCDPPYKGTATYGANKDNFDHDKFWRWCRDKVKEGHQVFISEYSAPDDFVCIWEKTVNNSLTKNTGAKKGTEKLFIYGGEDESR